MKRQFKGVWIPADLYLHDGLSWCQKLIIIEVDSFSRNGLACFVSNEHLATFTNHSISTVEKALASLVRDGYLMRERRKVDGKHTRFLRVDTRKICDLAPVKSADQQPHFLRPTLNNITNQPNKPKKEGTPSNLEAVLVEFEKQQSTPLEAQKFFDYYEANGWTQGRGKKIVSWRAAARQWIRRAAEFNKQNQANGFDSSKIDANRLANYIASGNG